MSTFIPLLAQASNLSRFDTALVRLVDTALNSPLLTVAALAAALGVGALHALTPGHGKTVAAAYLVGGRGRPRDAVLLGVVVAAMHSASVLVLGLALGALLRSSPTPAPLETITPALRVASGLFVLALGTALVVRRWRGRHHATDHHHTLPPGVEPLSRRGLVVLGMAGGLLPSPAAFLVLVTTSFAGRLWFGLLLVAMFSVGLASTLTLIGLAVVRGRQSLLTRLDGRRSERLVRLAGIVGTVGVLLGGVVMTAAGLAAL